jgi:AcrR family transcriptional regulator
MVSSCPQFGYNRLYLLQELAMKSADRQPRRYDASGRQEQARRNRRTVLDAAHRLFVAQGYAKTTVAAVAAEAGVSVETVYKGFTNKPGLVKAVFDVAVVGDDEDVPMLEREFVARNTAEPDPRRKLEGYGEHLATVAPRIGPILLVVRAAAASDAGAAEVWEQLQAERLTGMAVFAQHLDGAGFLREGVTRDEARDVLWTHSSVELWDLLVRQRGWSNPRFGRWVGHQLIAALL